MQVKDNDNADEDAVVGDEINFTDGGEEEEEEQTPESKSEAPQTGLITKSKRSSIERVGVDLR